MTNIVFQFRNKVSGKFLANVDTTSLMISFSEGVGQIYSKHDQVRRLIQRVETVRNTVENDKRLQRLAPKTSAKYRRPDHIKKAVKLVKAFDQCELVASEVKLVHTEVPNKKEFELVVRQSTLDCRIETGLTNIAHSSFGNIALATAFRNLKSLEDGKKYKVLTVVQQSRSFMEDKLNEQGIAYLQIETHKYKVFAFKSKKDLNFINLIHPNSFANWVEVSKVSALEKRLIKKLDRTANKQ
jgi:hypothetical protein